MTKTRIPARVLAWIDAALAALPVLIRYAPLVTAEALFYLAMGITEVEHAHD